MHTAFPSEGPLAKGPWTVPLLRWQTPLSAELVV